MLTKPGVHALAWLIILLLALPSGTLGQQSSAPPVFKQQELDQLVAPIALYPDSLVAQILNAGFSISRKDGKRF